MCSLQNGVLTMVSMAVGSQTTLSLCLKVGVSCSCCNAMTSLGTGGASLSDRGIGPEDRSNSLKLLCTLRL